VAGGLGFVLGFTRFWNPFERLWPWIFPKKCVILKLQWVRFRTKFMIELSKLSNDTLSLNTNSTV
jgi:hypothetical protein